MNTRIRFVGGAIALAALTTALGLAAQSPFVKPTQPTKIAKQLVTETAGVHYGELVLITGNPRNIDLLEKIALEIRAIGAHPLISVTSDQLQLGYYTQVPDRFDEQEPLFALKMAELIDAHIAINTNEDPTLLKDIDDERIITRSRAMKPVYEKMLERGVVQTHLGNGLYPTRPLARQFDIAPEMLSKIFWNGVAADTQKMESTGTRLKEVFVAGHTVKITAPNGTNLAFRIENRPCFVSDGVVSPDDRYAGGPACQVWLPAGEVYGTPVPGTANGTFIAENFFFQGKLIKNLTMKFKKGKMTSLTGDGNTKALMARYNAVPADIRGKDLFAAFDIGINPEVRIPAGSKMVAWMAEGTITIGVGNNVWANGNNEVPFDLFAHLKGGTLTVDGKTVVRKGQLKIR